MMRKKKSILSVCVLLALLISVISIPVLADASKEVNQAELFEVSGATVEVKEYSVDFTLTEKTASIKFKRALSASGFSLYWNGVEDQQKLLDTMVVALKDSADENRSVQVTYETLSDDYTAMQFNGEDRAYLVAGATYKANATDFSLMFQENTNVFTDEAESFEIESHNYNNGDHFAGFPSLAVNLEFTLSGKPGASFSLKALNDQFFGSEFSLDETEPRLAISTEAVKEATLNSTVTILPAAALDVFQEESTIQLTVNTPEGEILETEDGIKLSKVDGTKAYIVKLTEYGVYRVKYVVSDGINKSRGMGYQITVSDTGAPVVELAEEMNNFLTVGKEFTFPKIKVTDNASKECTTWINVMHPDGYMSCEKDSFTPDKEGHYTITFNAMDENGNIGRLRVQVYAERSGE